MVTGMTCVSIGLRGMGIDVDVSSIIAESGESNLVEGEGECKWVGGMKNKIGERMHKPEQIRGHGWVGLRRAAVFLFKRGRGRGPESKCAMHASTHCFLLPPFSSTVPSTEGVELEKPIHSLSCVLWKIHENKFA
jgi:hypothetical protein